MRALYDDSVNFKCSDISVNGNTFKYKDFSNIVSEYASVGNFTCEEKSGDVNISLPISVKQLTDEKFDITIETKDTYVAPETPSGGSSSTSTPSKPSTPSSGGSSNSSSSNVGTVGLCGACSVNKDCKYGTCSGTCYNSAGGTYKCCVDSSGRQCN